MKRYGVGIALLGALIFGAISVILAWTYMRKEPAVNNLSRVENPPATQLVVASREINFGTVLTRDNLFLKELPAGKQHQDTYKDIREVEGRVVISNIESGMPIRESALAKPGSGIGLVAVIPQGKRALTIKVNEVVGVAGFIQPNTFVDVVGVRGKNKETLKAKTLLERLKVLAIAQETLTEDGMAKVVKTVTLEVTPEQVVKLVLATHQGAVQLALRNPLEDDRQEAASQVVSVQKEPAERERRKAIPVLASRIITPKPTPFAVEIIRASKRETIEFKHTSSPERVWQ